MANVHADSYGSLTGVEVAAICGRSPAPAQALAGRLGAAAVERFDDILSDATIGAIDICTPTPSHGPLVLAALEAGKHVFCETPLALKLAEAVAMRDAARRNGRLLLAGLLMRSIAQYAHFESSVRSGALGRPLAAAAYRLGSYLLPGASDHKPHYSDPTTELMTFDFDALNWCFGMPLGVSARATMQADGRPGHVFATLQYEGFVASVEASGLMPASAPFRAGLKVVGTVGALELRNEFRDPEPPDSSFVFYPTVGDSTPVEIQGHDPYEAECAYFVECVRGTADGSLLDVERAIDALRISLATQEAIRTGQFVEISSDGSVR